MNVKFKSGDKVSSISLHSRLLSHDKLAGLHTYPEIRRVCVLSVIFSRHVRNPASHAFHFTGNWFKTACFSFVVAW